MKAAPRDGQPAPWYKQNRLYQRLRTVPQLRAIRASLPLILHLTRQDLWSATPAQCWGHLDFRITR